MMMKWVSCFLSAARRVLFLYYWPTERGRKLLKWQGLCHCVSLSDRLNRHILSKQALHPHLWFTFLWSSLQVSDYFVAAFYDDFCSIWAKFLRLTNMFIILRRRPQWYKSPKSCQVIARGWVVIWREIIRVKVIDWFVEVVQLENYFKIKLI